jgi:hypothetical protein
MPASAALFAPGGDVELGLEANQLQPGQQVLREAE